MRLIHIVIPKRVLCTAFDIFEVNTQLGFDSVFIVFLLTFVQLGCDIITADMHRCLVGAGEHYSSYKTVICVHSLRTPYIVYARYTVYRLPSVILPLRTDNV